VVAALRRLCPRGARVGHAGTLDPAAAGVLPVCLGPATRLADYLHLPPKEYRFELVLGLETDTQDTSGATVAERDASGVTAGAVAAALRPFLGTVRQRPPAYSARHVGGRRLHELARAGHAPEPEALPEREVQIFELRLLRFRPGPRARALCALVCGSGTYVRSLCAEVGAALGPGGCAGALVRVRAGGLRAAECPTLEEIASAVPHGGWRALLRSPARALWFLPAVELEAGAARGVRDGRPPAPRPADPGERPGPVRLLGPGGELLAVARREVSGGRAAFALERVLPPA
jgi:tRNA pseudouridine55 synthase